MPQLTQCQVRRLYEANLERAQAALSHLEVSSGKKPTFSGLTGWVFERTVEHCIRQELKRRRLCPAITEQARIGRRGKADLMVGTVAVEVKLSGVFSQPAIQRYAKYATEARAASMPYLYLAGGEAYRNYRAGVAAAFGRNNVFFLDRPDQWPRFIARLVALLRDPASSSTLIPRKASPARRARVQA